MFRRKQAPALRTLEQDFVDVVRQMGLTVVTVDAEHGVVKMADGEHIIGFANVRPHWERASLEERPQVIAHFVGTLFSMASAERPKSYEEVRPMLVPRLAFPEFGASAQTPQGLPKWEIVPEHLAVFLVIDFPQTVSYVMPDDLAAWNVTFETAYADAFENLRRRTDLRRVMKPFDKLPQLRVYNEGDSFDAARALLLGDFLQPWPPGGAVFAVPTRDHFMFAAVEGVETMKAIQAMITLNEKFLQDPSNPISSQVFWYDGNGFERIAVMEKDGKLAVLPPDRLMQTMAGLGTRPGG